MIERIKKEASLRLKDMIGIRRHLHQNPELSFKEYNTSKFIQSKLTELNIPFEVVCETGIVAMIHGKSGGRIIALRADIDALPIQERNTVDYTSQNEGVMHACGHDVHSASLLGVASILSAMKDEFIGSVKLIFQLGEEKLPGGASMMIDAGALKNPVPEIILGQHVYPELEAGKVGFRPGKYMASADEVYLTVKGKGGHAALPDRNIDPVLITAHIIVALQQIVSRRVHPNLPCVLSFGKVNAEGATNVIPNEVTVAGTFRTFDETWRQKAHELIREIAEHTAIAMGGECDVDIRVGYPFVNNNEALTQRAIEGAAEYLGQENVEPLEMRMTGEDFAYYSQVMPGTFYRLGTKQGEEGELKGLHTPTFDVDESCLEVGAGLMAYLAIKELEG